jgi:alpha-tubulin suppressor-like RCC1 family protein
MKTKIAFVIASIISASSQAVVTNVASDYGHTLLIPNESTGEVFAMGFNNSKVTGPYAAVQQLTPVPVGLVNIKTVATSYSISMALSNTGYVYWWGAEHCYSYYDSWSN